ncbi:MAG TPA: toll/interleukin-1 receptor domain-containing protein [Lachnospiraceae bacterium]|nr:toll/interleukin-1 receptor domain-containing protein [Lachnospiraceae bacterium]
MKTFISHSTKDADLAQNICNAFEEKGMKCFIAPRDINAGCVYSEEIMRGIDLCDAMVLIASKSSFESQHVLRELERAVDRRMKIIVYKIDESPIPKSFEYFIMLNQWIDASASPKLQELINVVCLDNKETKNAQTDTKEVRQEKKGIAYKQGSFANLYTHYCNSDWHHNLFTYSKG